MTVANSASSINAVVRDYAFPDVHVGGSEEESPWVPFKGNTTFIRHLAFDVRNNTYANLLWVKQGGSLGRHRHRGRVFLGTPSKAAGATWSTIGSPGPAATSRKVPEPSTPGFPTKA